MARPITWQDIAAPNQTGNLLASARAGQQITEALSGLGGVGMAAYDQAKEDATKAAVASIANAADPVAAAAAAPQNWAVDPLAVANAANSRNSQLLQNRAAEASINASTTSTAANQASLDDRIAEREASTMSSPMIDNILKTGKLPKIDLTKDEWKTAAGNRAYKQVLDFWGQYTDDQRAAETLHFQRKEFQKRQNEEDFLGWAREYGASVKGQGDDPATIDRVLVAEAKRRGVSVGLVDPATAMVEKGASVNKASQEELNREAFFSDKPSENLTYRGVSSVVDSYRQNIESQRLAALNAPVKEGSNVSLMQLQELAQGPAFKEGPMELVASQLSKASGGNLDLAEAQDRIRRIQGKYPTLLNAQAASIALDTQDRWNTWFRNPANSDEAVAKAGRYAELNVLGGNAAVANEVAKATAGFDAQLARIPVIQRQVTAAARAGEILPDSAVDIIKEFKDAKSKEEKRLQDQQAATVKAAAESALRKKNVRNAAPFITWQGQ